MFWFNYEYIKSSELFNNFLKIKDYWLLEYLLLFIGIIIINLLIFIIIPKIYLFLEKNNENKEKKAKKRMIDKIILQKNLEDLVMREINEKKWK